jgi:4-hydroxybenzoate polyprenyltransferase
MMNALSLYLSMARLNHWTKQLFVLPGIVLAMLVFKVSIVNSLWSILLGIGCTCIIASANYTINEWLDRKSDAHHPLKKNRSAVSGDLKKRFVLLQYGILSTVGIALATFVSPFFVLFLSLFLLSGITYNVPPIRTKDKVYVDVITEAVNNPLRLYLGWTIISSATVPPTSFLFAYWFGGAFLMSVKRLAEYRYISTSCADGQNILVYYRASFSKYTETSLLLSSVMYALLSLAFLTVFLTKYRMEFILMIPFWGVLFVYYLWLGLHERSIAQTPEKLFKEKGLILIICMLLILFLSFTMIDIPILTRLFEMRYDYKAFH